MTDDIKPPHSDDQKRAEQSFDEAEKELRSLATEEVLQNLDEVRCEIRHQQVCAVPLNAVAVAFLPIGIPSESTAGAAP